MKKNVVFLLLFFILISCKLNNFKFIGIKNIEVFKISSILQEDSVFKRDTAILLYTINDSAKIYNFLNGIKFKSKENIKFHSSYNIIIHYNDSLEIININYNALNKDGETYKTNYSLDDYIECYKKELK